MFLSVQYEVRKMFIECYWKVYIKAFHLRLKGITKTKCLDGYSLIHNSDDKNVRTELIVKFGYIIKLQYMN